MSLTIEALRTVGTDLLRKQLHGCELVVQGPRTIVDCLAARLQYLAPASTGSQETQLRFDYVEAGDSDASVCPRPASRGRAFYQPAQGEATYWPGDDVCYLQLGSDARALCHPAEGRCLVALAPPVADKLWQAAHPLFTLPLLEMLRRRGLFFIHAASLALGSRCILLAGTSGAGKSTLTLALLQAGAAYMGDDLAFLDGEAATRILAFPETVSATQQTLGFFAEHEQWILDPRPAGWPKFEIAPQSVGGLPFCGEAAPGALVFPEVAHRPGSVLTAIHPDEAFQRLAANLLLTEHACTKAHAAALAALARTTPAYRLATGTNLSEAAGRLHELLA